MKKSILKSTILLSASILSMATVSVFADDELVPTTAVTEVANHSVGNSVEQSNDVQEAQLSGQMMFKRHNRVQLI